MFLFVDPFGRNGSEGFVTCYPFVNLGPAPQRFIVHAVQVDSPRPPDTVVGTR